MQQRFQSSGIIKSEKAMRAYWAGFFENLARAIEERTNPDVIEVSLFKDKDGISFGDKRGLNEKEVPERSAINLYASVKNGSTLLWMQKEGAPFWRCNFFSFPGHTIGMQVIARFDQTNPLPSQQQAEFILKMVKERIQPYLTEPLPKQRLLGGPVQRPNLLEHIIA
jgi:hypothetical protein